MGVASYATYVHLVSYVLVALTDGLLGKAEGGLELVVPGEHRALSGDLEVHVLGGWAGLTGKLLLLQRPLFESGSSPDSWEHMGSVPLTWTDKSSAQARFPCGVISRGGRYGVRLFVAGTGNQSDTDQVTELDVRWPGASLKLEPHEIQTYPEDTVTAKLNFQQTHCEPALGTREPETWLDLLYCGHSPNACTYPNNTLKQLVYSEQIRGYPENREIALKCELFGMAGHYALALRPSIQDNGEPIASTLTQYTLKAIWSERFVFNVHARSIFPCDGHSGVPVLFQYPSCILPQGDRVRLFSRLRADVSSLAPPSSLHYVAEQRVLRGRHSLRFDCSLFSEKFVEYCFVYVSQSITGAVSDVRMDCVPTLPVLELESGGWGQWSSWTQCTSTCSGGTRNRYRFCDSPPPRYGARFCQGHALETESCGTAGAWDCRYYPDTGSGEVPADRPEVKAEIGPGCRCGCIVHLGTGKTRRLIAASSHSCPGRTFWLIQTDKNRSVRLSMEQFRLPCASQSLKIRDGDSSTAKLLERLTGTPLEVPVIVSSSSSLLIEFDAGDIITSGDECSGGFLAHASQIDRRESNFTSPVVAETVSNEWTSSGLVNAGLVLTLLMAVVASACLGVQYIYRYHKYQLAAAADDMESFDNSCGSIAVGRSRATSSSTLLSDVISLHRFRGNKHTRLNEENTELLEQNRSETRDDELDEIKCDEKMTKLNEVEKRPTSLEVPRTPQLPRRQIRLLKNRKFMSPVSPVEEGPEDEDGDKTTRIDNSSPKPRSEKSSRPSASSSQSSTLTNVSTYSFSKGSTPSVGVNAKETKDKKNRERVLAGSEFSLNGPDLEMDYYDYNVQNAVPGSYLAMDPAFCLWIPPFAPGVWDETEFKGSKENISKSNESIFKDEMVRSVSNRALSGILYSTEDDSAANLVEKSAPGSPVKVHQYPKKTEKETHVEKSPGSSGDYYDILENEEGIKFADDEEDDDKKVQDDKPPDRNKSTVIVQVHARNAYFNK